MKCKNCKQKLPPLAQFCPNCGSDVKAQKKEKNSSALEFVIDLAELILDIVTDIDIDI